MRVASRDRQGPGRACRLPMRVTGWRADRQAPGRGPPYAGNAIDLESRLAKGLGVELVPASAPDFFLTDTPTAVLVRQVLGAIAQFEKASLVAKLKAAR